MSALWKKIEFYKEKSDFEVIVKSLIIFCLFNVFMAIKRLTTLKGLWPKNQHNQPVSSG